MSEIDMQQILNQMRVMAARVEGLPQSQPVRESGFADLLGKAVDQVNQTQHQADRLATAFQRGDDHQEIMKVVHFKSLTGLTRKYSIPLLEYCDRLGYTIRRGDERISGDQLRG